MRRALAFALAFAAALPALPQQAQAQTQGQRRNVFGDPFAAVPAVLPGCRCRHRRC